MIYRNYDGELNRGTFEFWESAKAHVTGKESDTIFATVSGPNTEPDLISIRGLKRSNIILGTDDPKLATELLEVVGEEQVAVTTLKDLREDYTRHFGLMSIEFIDSVSMKTAIEETSDTVVKCASKDSTFHIAVGGFDRNQEIAKLEEQIVAASKALGENDIAGFGTNFVGLFSGIKAPWLTAIDHKAYSSIMFDTLADVPQAIKDSFLTINPKRVEALSKALYFTGSLVRNMYFKNRACAVYGISAEDNGSKCRFHCYGVAKTYDIRNSKPMRRKAQEFMTSGAIAPKFNYYTKE